jgi:hypothetical protein
MKKLAFLALAAGLILPTGLRAEDKSDAHGRASFKVAMTTDSKYSRDEKTVFSTDAKGIYAVYRLVVSGPMKLRVAFWADGAEGLDSKTKLLEKTVAFPQKGEYMGAIEALKPANGWPVGTYHVEMILDDALSKTVPFKVAKN